MIDVKLWEASEGIDMVYLINRPKTWVSFNVSDDITLITIDKYHSSVLKKLITGVYDWVTSLVSS